MLKGQTTPRITPNLGEGLNKSGEGAGKKTGDGNVWASGGPHLSYLLKNEEQPFGYACDSLYTVRHILIECPDFQITRRKYFNVTDMYRLFREVHSSRIVGYLKELGNI
ncbi:ribonuclease hi [Plakobranchus ocellatus]|uniref:Ribonuclease hi n=1 Tax=Plakobranchus ocellatus TaxID=259542 RepID=A0AAV4C9Y6_9GAST|nr:ribonuclease hi [Plakobranchus ocellatus]